MKSNLIYRAFLVLGFLFFSIFVMLLLIGKPDISGLFLISGFVSMAVAFRGYSFLKGFSYPMWIFAAVTLSMYFPQYFLQIGDFQLKRLIVPLLQIIMFGMGSQMSLKDFEGVIKMPKGVIVGIICQYTIMPFIGVSVAILFGFPPEIAAGIVLVGSSPSGLASNVMSFIAKANLALSVTLTACATLLSPLITPFLMKTLAGQFIEVDFWNMMIGIFNMTILPIIAGLIFNIFSITKVSNKGKIIQLFSYFLIILLKNFIAFQTTEIEIEGLAKGTGMDVFWFMILPVAGTYLFKWLAKGDKELLSNLLAFVSMLGIGVIIVVITAAGRDSLLDVGLLLILACFIHNMFGYGLGYSIAKYILRMPEKDCRTIALEVGMQNGGLASGLALQMGKVATVGLAPAIFGPMMNITGSSLATWWRNKEVGGFELKKDNSARQNIVEPEKSDQNQIKFKETEITSKFKKTKIKKINIMKNLILLIALIAGTAGIGQAQIVPSMEMMKFYTPKWEGERDASGRPLVSDELMDRLLDLSIEEAWGVLRGEGYHNQFEGGWTSINDEPFVGRALTVQYSPTRPDIQEQIEALGKKEGRIGASNSWPIDMLKERDVYVADGWGKVIDGTLIGDNLGNSIYAKSKTGVVFDAGARDLEGLSKIEGFNAFTRGFDPSFIVGMTVTGINQPIRIGRAAVVPGDVVLAKREGVIFIPAHLVQKVVITGEFIALRDKFGHEMLRKGVYTPGQIDTKWTDDIKESFLKWLDENEDSLPMSRKELDEYMKNRTW